MLFSSVFISTLLAGTAWAEGVNMRQNMPKPSNTNSAQGPQGSGQGNGQVKMHVIKVGSAENKLVFEPKNLTAEVGSMIQFQFWPKNHSVARSSFNKPCVPVEQSTPGSMGFFSGFMPVQLPTMGVFTIMVTDPKPIWFYCAKDKHCQSGMVGVINAPTNDTSKTIDTFTDLAKKAPDNIAPGGNNSSSSAPFSNSTSPTNGVTPPGTTPSSTGQAPAAATTAAAANTRVGGAIAIVALGMALLA